MTGEENRQKFNSFLPLFLSLTYDATARFFIPTASFFDFPPSLCSSLLFARVSTKIMTDDIFRSKLETSEGDTGIDAT